MATVNGAPGFSQLNKLNVIEELRVGGDLIGSSAFKEVSTKADFPTPSGGTITLEPYVTYDVIGAVGIDTDTITYSEGSLLRGTSPENSSLIYTGTGVMINGVDQTIEIQDLFLSYGSGTFLDHTSSTGDHGVFLIRVNGAGLNHGEMGTQSGAIFDACFFVAFNEGFKYKAGATSGIFVGSLSSIVALGGSSIALDLNDAVITSFRLTPTDIQGSNISLSGLPNGGNIGSEGIVSGSKFSGTALQGITKKDAKWNFQNCIGIVSSTVYGAALMQDNATNTVLTQNVPAPVTGTFSEPTQAERAATSVAGIITMSNEQSETGTLFVSMDVEKQGAGTPDLNVTIRKNGTDIPNVKQFVEITNNSVNLSLCSPTDFVSGDTYQIYLENITNNTDMLVRNLQFLVTANGGL